jgi:hypothetical protein
MQSLFYTLIGKEEPQQQHQQHLVQVFELLEAPGDQTINQIQRKIRLMNEFKLYIEKANTNNKTIYYRYIVNTEIHEGFKREGEGLVGTIREIYVIKPGFFGNLYEYKTSENVDDIFITLALLEL